MTHIWHTLDSLTKLLYGTGHSGGIFAFWNEANIQLQILGRTTQELLQVTPNSPPFLFSITYSNCDFQNKLILWNNLRNVFELVHHKSLHWIVLGYFNEILHEQKKFVGNPISIIRSRAFRQCLNDCKLIHVGFKGPRFTSTNKRGLIMERLDRMLVKSEWMNIMPNTNVIHLPRLHSDHCPLKINFQSNISINPPFRFKQMWVQHPDFNSVVSSSWTSKSLMILLFLLFNLLLLPGTNKPLGIFSKKKKKPAG